MKETTSNWKKLYDDARRCQDRENFRDARRLLEEALLLVDGNDDAASELIRLELAATLDALGEKETAGTIRAGLSGSETVSHPISDKSGSGSEKEKIAIKFYVGALTPILVGKMERVARSNGLISEKTAVPYEIILPHVLKWREGLSLSLKGHINAPLEWDESESSPGFTAMLNSDCYGALLLWAAYSEHKDLTLPVNNPLCDYGGDWHTDPAFQRSVAEGFNTKYSQMLHNVSAWLPSDFIFTFDAPWVTSYDKPTRRYGSCSSLVWQLDELNSSTWKAVPDEIACWNGMSLDPNSTLESYAKSAFALIRDFAGRANEFHLPMVAFWEKLEKSEENKA